MKKILVNETNMNKIAEAIKAAQGRATARTITKNTVTYLIKEAEHPLKNRPFDSIPKARLHGTTINYTGGEKFPSAYKWRPESTHCIIENHKGKWYLMDVSRDTCPNCKSHGFIKYSEDAKAWIMSSLSTL